MAVDPQTIVSKAVKSLHDNNKLLLVLDIDHTLVHCTKDERAEIVMSDASMKSETFKMYFEETGDKPYYLKLRPFIKPFLETLSQFFHLAVYTMGGKTYAKQVMKIIDPENTILKKRLVCRDDHDDNIKVLQRMFPCDERMVLVVDDRDDVWSTPENVLKIWKFEFWPSDANDDDANMAPQEVKGKSTPDEDWAIDKLRQRNHDNILGTTANVLQAIHRIYYHDEGIYRSHKVCAHAIYSQLQRRVFSGVHIVFSGVFPNNEAPEDTQEWKLAVQYGATCHLELNDRVTHVVAARAGTAKVHKARKRDVYVVHINWLRQSVIHFIRMFEPDFPIGSRVKPTTVSAHCSQPIDIMELSDFILDATRKKPKIFRPSELYLTFLDSSHPDYDHEKYKKYKYFVQQRDALLKRNQPAQPAPKPPVQPPPQKRNPPPQPVSTRNPPSQLIPPRNHPPQPSRKHLHQPVGAQNPPLQPLHSSNRAGIPPQPAVAAPGPHPPNGPFRYPNHPKAGYPVPQGRGPILNSRLPPTGAGPLISTPAIPANGIPATQPLRRAVRRPRQNANPGPPKPPPQRFPSVNASALPVPPKTSVPPVAPPKPTAPQAPEPTSEEVEKVKEQIVSFLADKYWTPTEVVYVYLREHFDVLFLKKVGMENEDFYKKHTEFKITQAERRWIVRLANAVTPSTIPGKRTSNDAGHTQAPPTKRKKIESKRDPSPVPDFAMSNRHTQRQEKQRRDKTYNQIKAKKKAWVPEGVPPRRKLKPKKYGPPGQERNFHPLDPKDYRSRQPCKFYQEGGCLKQKCFFLHDEHQLYMRPPNDEWAPLAEKDFRKQTAPPKTKKRKKTRKLSTSASGLYDQHDRRSPNKRRQANIVSDDESDYFSPKKRRNEDDDFSSLLKQHLGDDYREETETPNKQPKMKMAKKRKREPSPTMAADLLEGEKLMKKKQKSNEPEELFDENLHIIGTVEKDDEAEEGECSDDSDDDEENN